jgi:hypothetical protein
MTITVEYAKQETENLIIDCNIIIRINFLKIIKNCDHKNWYIKYTNT